MGRARPGRFDALLLTSANAVRHGGAGACKASGCRSMPSARRPPRRRGRPDFDVATVGAGDVATCSASCRPRSACCTLPAKIIATPTDQRGSIGASVYRSRDLRRPAICRRCDGLVAAVHQPARRQAAGRAGRPRPARPSASRRSARRPPRPAAAAGSGSRSPTSPTTTACWPSPRGCATHRRRNDRWPPPDKA